MPNTRIGGFALVLLAATLSIAGAALQSEGEDRELSLAEVRQQRGEIDRSTGLEESLKLELLDLYDQAISDLGEAAAAVAQARGYRLQRSGVEARVNGVRAELDRLQLAGSIDLPESDDARQVEDRLTREVAQLSSLRVSLRDLQELAEERLRRRNEIGALLGNLDQQLEAVNSELRAAADLGTPEYQAATRTRLLAQRQSLVAASESGRAELDLLEARARLLPWRRDLAEVQVARQEDYVHRLETRVQVLRQASARENLERIRELTAALDEELSDPEARQFTSSVMQLADELWAPSGVITQTLKTEERLAVARGQITTLEGIAQLTRRRYEAIGQRGDITQWYPEIPPGFPRIVDIENRIEESQALIPEIQHRLIQYEQERARFLELQREVEEFLARHGAFEGEADRAWELVHQRQEILDRLISYSGRYSSGLIELVAVWRNLLELGQGLSSFVNQRALWVRSVPGSIVPGLQDTLAAIAFVLSPSNWWGVLRELAQAVISIPVRLVGGLLLLAGMLVYRRRIAARLTRIGRRVRKGDPHSFRLSLEAMAHTVMLAAPGPWALFLAGRVLVRSDVGFNADCGAALLYTAEIHMLFELARQWLRPDGMAVAHLGWRSRNSDAARAGLLWPQVLFLPAIFVSILLGLSSVFLDSPQQMQEYSNSLGRLAFIFGVGGLGLSLSGVFRPTGGRTARKISLYALPAITVCLTLPALLALTGYYVTGILLAYQALRTAWLLVGLRLLAAVVGRWLETRARGAVEQPDAETTTELRIARERQEEELELAEERTRELAHFAIVVLLFVGLFSIWAPALPALEFLKRVQIWPAVTVLDESAGQQAARTAILAPAAAESRQPAEQQEVAGQLPPASSDSSAETGPVTSVTLWHLLQALVAGLITAALVRNVPGVVELVLMKRTFLDSGARIAIATLVRYSIMILGVVITFGFLGITWAKTQWLAAALTFGLGFGLQEIVANFVSGLILLLERPVRVGDAVRIGELQGRVTRTQIRATTIALFDRSEMIVPNKEFITKTLVNWTLSDSRRRIEIPIRVAYGSNLKHVKQVLVDVASSHPDVLQDPPANPLVVNFADDAIRMELRVFVDFGQGLKVKDELIVAVDEAFKREGIAFALPKMAIEVPGDLPSADPRQGGETRSDPNSTTDGQR